MITQLEILQPNRNLDAWAVYSSKKSGQYERVMAALAREKTDVFPVSLWTHTGALSFLGFDFEKTCKNGEEMANANMSFLRKFEVDLLKVTPYGGNLAINWGNKCKWTHGSEWVDTVAYAIKNDDDWDTIKVLDIEETTVSEELKAAEIMREKIGGKVPFVWTIMGVLNTAGKLAGDDLVLSGIRSNSDALKNALDAISDTLARFGRELLSAGSDGVFYSVRPGREHSMWDRLTRMELEEFSFKYDQKVLEALHDADIRILHICTGHRRQEKPKLVTELMDEGYFAKFPVHAINWWDRCFFDLRHAKTVYGNRFCLIGGLDQEQTLPYGTPQDVEKEAENAIESAGADGGLIVGPGCTIRTRTTERNFAAAVNSVHAYR